MYRAIIFDFFDVIRTDPYKAWLKKHGINRSGEYVDISKQLDIGEIDLGTFFSRLSSLSGQPVDTITQEYKNTGSVNIQCVSHLAG